MSHSSFHVVLSQEVGAKKDRLDFEQFHKLYNHIMFEQKEVSLNLLYKSKYALHVLLYICYPIFITLCFLTQILDEFKKESCAFILG